MRLCILRGCGYPEAQPRGCNRNQGGYQAHILQVGPQYLTYCVINLASDWSRAKSPGGGAVPIKESVATENHNQSRNREGDAAGFST